MSLLGNANAIGTPNTAGTSKQAIEGAMGRQVALAEARTNLEAMSLTTRQDILAEEKGKELQEIDNDLATVNANIKSGGLRAKTNEHRA